MEHQWRPHQNQGNICPTCSISHFPFCPPQPHPSNFNPNYYQFNPNYNNNNTPTFNNPGDSYSDPSFSHRNPNLPHVGAPYPNQNPGYGDSGYPGNDYNNVIERSSKRLRIDGGGSDPNFSSRFPMEGIDKRLNLVDDYGGPNMGYGVGGDLRGNSFENRRNLNPSEIGMRLPSNVGYNANFRKDGSDYPTSYGSQYDMKRGVSDLGYQNHDQQRVRDGMGYQSGYGSQYDMRNHDQGGVQFGQMGKSPDSTSFYPGSVGHGNNYPNYGSSYGFNEGGYGSNELRNPSNDQRSNMSISNHYSSNYPPVRSVVHQSGQLRYDYGDLRQPLMIQGYQDPVGNQNPNLPPHYGNPNVDYKGCYGNPNLENVGYPQPPLPASPPPPPPPPLPIEPPAHWVAEHKHLSSPPRVSSSLFPVSVDNSTPVNSSHAPISEAHIRAPLPISQYGHTARVDFQRDPQSNLRSYGQYIGDGQTYPPKNNVPEKPKIVDASHLFKPPHRASRPDHFVIILRGLPGSGKSYLAKMLRDLEVEQGGKAPRIHSMDDYFMTEVEKVDENEFSKSTSIVKKPTMKTVLEYCYEPEMEEAYRTSMLKAFKKTLEDGTFTVVIVDDRNLRVADFAQFWAIAKRSGYEVYVLEAPYKDPAGCTARNVHGFTHVDVEKMAAQWEEAPSMYLQVDVKSLFHGDDLKESNIEEVDMDTEDGDIGGDLFKGEERGAERNIMSPSGNLRQYESQKNETDFEAEIGNPSEVVKDLGRSKWSDLDGDEDEKTEVLKGKANVSSGLAVTFRKEGKSVHWGDQNGHSGFSIGVVKKANPASLIIGPGQGYNLKSNPLLDEDETTGKSGEKKQRSRFQERLRAEQESFKAVFDRRRHRISGLVADED